MSIAHYDPTEPVRAPEPLSVVTDPSKFAVYDGEVDPGFSLEASLSGSPWQVRAFFRQILGVADNPKELDVNLPAALQYYEKIKDLELLIQGQLSSNYDPKLGIMATTGESLMYSFLRINVCDYFIAESNIGRLGLFKVDEVIRASHEKMSAFRFRFSQIAELTNDHPLYLALENKVSVVKVFSKARLIEGGQPILLEKQYADIRNLRHEYQALVSDYWDTFFRQDRGTLFIPGQVGFIYDPFLVAFFSSLVDSTEVPEKQQLIFLSENNDPIYRVKNIWQVLRQRGLEKLRYARLKMKMVNPAFFGHVALSHSAYFANTDFTLYPDEFDRSSEIKPISQWEKMTTPGVSFQTGPCAREEEFNLKFTKNAFGEELDPSTFTMSVAGIEWPLVNRVTSGLDYIFTSDFYREKPTSVLEIMLLDYIARRPINLGQLMEVIRIYPELPRLEQFYFGPMLMVMIKETRRGAVS